MPTKSFFTTVPIQRSLQPGSNSGSPSLTNISQLQIGAGDTLFRADAQGIALGGKTFEDAPFSVDLNGNMKSVSSSVTGDANGYTVLIQNGTIYFRDQAGRVVGLLGHQGGGF